MKKLLLLLAFSILHSSFSIAQEWFPVGAKWTYGWSDRGCFNPNFESFYPEYYEIEKDTVILGRTCKKMVRQSNHPSVYGRKYNYVFDSADKVYYYPPYEYENTRMEWSLLYDFTKQAGDTIWYENMLIYDSNIGDTIKYYVVVDSVYEIILNGDTLSRYFARPTASLFFYWTDFAAWWITEIIGGTFSIFPGAHYAGGCTYPEGLRCYEDSVFGYYQNPWFTLDCDTSYGINTPIDNPLSEIAINIFPNPAKNMLNISISQSQIFNSLSA
jgi:hypothetical protein